MNISIYQQLLEITESMLVLCENEQWAELAIAEKQRAKILLEIEKCEEANNFLNKKQEAVEVLKKITAINQKIHQHAKNKRHLMKNEILQLQKGKKAKQYYKP